MDNIGRFLVIVLLIFLSTGIFFAQSSEERVEHRELSNQLYDFFVQEGFQPQRQLLTNSNQFPYTILLDFNQKRFTEDQEIQRFIIAISQETAQESLDEIVALANKMKSTNAEVRLTLALLANENTFKKGATKAELMRVKTGDKAACDKGAFLNEICSNLTEATITGANANLLTANKAFLCQFIANYEVVKGAVTVKDIITYEPKNGMQQSFLFLV